MTRRSKLEICFDVLNIVNKGVFKPTQIMYKTNLSWSVLQGILNTLIEAEFIRAEQRRKFKRYYITEKGINSLSYFRKSREELLPMGIAW